MINFENCFVEYKNDEIREENKTNGRNTQTCEIKIDDV